MAAGTEAGSVLFDEGKGRQVLGEPRFHQGAVVAVSFSSDGKHLLSAGGNLAAWWSLTEARLVRQIRGPQRLSAGLLGQVAGQQQAFLGTALGAVVGWKISQRSSEPIRELACSAFPVMGSTRQGPEAERCPYGTFVEAEDGSGAACVYPVTALALDGDTLWRACREGSLRGKRLGSASPVRGFGTGHLQTVTIGPDGLLLLGRAEGELRLLDPSQNSVVAELSPPGAPQAAAASGDLIAVARGDRVHLWVGASRQPSVELKAPSRVISLALQGGGVAYLTETGRAEQRAILRR